LVEITWQDAWSSDRGWSDEEGLIDSMAAAALNKTVGYVVSNRKRQVILAQNKCLAMGHTSTFTGIPWACVTKVRVLK
jgi:hypothetical protein